MRDAALHAAFWAAQQVVEAVGADLSPTSLIRDRDGLYGRAFDARVDNLGIVQVKTAPRSPWQNGYAERWVGTLRRELLDHVVVLGERHLLCLVRRYVDYYNQDGPHRSLERNAPVSRAVEPRAAGRIVALARVGGCIIGTRESWRDGLGWGLRQRGSASSLRNGRVTGRGWVFRHHNPRRSCSRVPQTSCSRSAQSPLSGAARCSVAVPTFITTAIFLNDIPSSFKAQRRPSSSRARGRPTRLPRLLAPRGREFGLMAPP